MTKSNILLSNYKDAKKISNEFLKEILDEFNYLVGKQKIIKLDTSWVSLEIKDDTTTSFPFYLTVNFHQILDYCKEILAKDKYTSFYSKLKEYNLFDINHNLTNPHFSPFGTLLINYIQLETEDIEKEEILKSFPIQFNQELFNKCWEAILPWLNKTPIPLRLYYFIYNAKFISDNTDYIISSTRNLKLRIPTNEEKKKLINELRITPSIIEGHLQAINMVSNIAQCDAWIETSIDITHEEDEKTIVDLDILHPSYIQEAFALLGYTDVIVRFLTFSNPLFYKKFYLEPSFDRSKGMIISNIFRQLPEWMNESIPKFRQSEILLSEEELNFLSLYPELRKDFTKDSVEKLVVTRMTRALRSNIVTDILLEIAIGIETLLVEGKGDLSLQFRLNTSWLIGKNYEDRKKISSFCNNLYSIRSVIVHEGGKYSQIVNKAEKTGGIQKTIELAIELYRLIILRMIIIKKKKISTIKQKELIELVKKARLSGKLEIKTYDVFEELYAKFMEKMSEI